LACLGCAALLLRQEQEQVVWVGRCVFEDVAAVCHCGLLLLFAGRLATPDSMLTAAVAMAQPSAIMRPQAESTP